MMEDFTIRTYGKQQLASLYFPDSDPTTAVKHLMRWISNCHELMEELTASGYRTTAKVFTPRQVKLITDYLGDP